MSTILSAYWSLSLRHHIDTSFFAKFKNIGFALGEEVKKRWLETEIYIFSKVILIIIINQFKVGISQCHYKSEEAWLDSEESATTTAIASCYSVCERSLLLPQL